MSGPDEQDIIQWQDALRWLDWAMDDIRAVRVLLRDGIAMQAALPEVESLFSAVIDLAPAALASEAESIRQASRLGSP